MSTRCAMKTRSQTQHMYKTCLQLGNPQTQKTDQEPNLGARWAQSAADGVEFLLRVVGIIWN